MNLFMSERFLRVIWYSGIAAFLIVSVAPLGKTPVSEINMGDKIAHFAVFFFLAMFPAATGAVSDRTALIFLLLLAPGSELIQSFIPYRTGEFLDIAADLAGMISGLGAGKLARSWFCPSEKWPARGELEPPRGMDQ